MKPSFLASTSLFALFAAACSSAAPSNEPAASSSEAVSADRVDCAGSVYVLSNDAAANEVLVFDRASGGSLMLAASVATGGAGSGDSLASEGALTSSRDGRWLFAVNAGDHTVSALRVHHDGSVALASVVDSGGDRPVSVAELDGLVYVLNAGDCQNVSGFVFDGAELSPIRGATRPLGNPAAGAAEVAFDASGDALVVTEKATNALDVFAIRRDGSLGAARTTPLSGATPYGFAVDSRGTIVVSDAVGGVAGAGETTSYRVDCGALDVVTSALGNGQSAPCWVAIEGAYAFVANTASGTVSSYAIRSRRLDRPRHERRRERRARARRGPRGRGDRRRLPLRARRWQPRRRRLPRRRGRRAHQRRRFRRAPAARVRARGALISSSRRSGDVASRRPRCAHAAFIHRFPARPV